MIIKKTILQGLAILAGFLAIWFAASQIDYMKAFHVNQIRTSSENKIGDLIWDEISKTEKVITKDSLTKTLDKLIDPICKKNGIERDSLKIHIVESNIVNAFALPNNHLVVYTGLILDCKKQEALQGVLCHEIAHIENNHVMKKLSKEVGLTVLLSATTGGKGGAVVKEIFRTLSSSAYDRTLEKEADMESVNYLLKADINPEPFADFMYEMAQTKNISDDFYWISDHPESEERAKYILDFLKGKKYKKTALLSDTDWTNYKKALKSEDGE